MARFFKVRPSVMTSRSTTGTPWLTHSISLLHQLSSTARVGLAVGGDHALVDPPGRFDLDVLLGREQVRRPLALLVGE
jgi:hypothetical protein